MRLYLSRFCIRVISVLLSIIFAHDCKASPQIPDYLLFRGDTLPVYRLILESYLQATDEPDIGRLFGLSFRENSSLNCWRGYQAVYSIEHDSLFLCFILGCGELKQKKYPVDYEQSSKKMQQIFGTKVVNGKVYADWYAGMIELPRGNILRWDGVFYRTYEKEEILSFKDGLLAGTSIVDNYIDLPEGISRRLTKGRYYFPGKEQSDTLFKLIRSMNWTRLDNCGCADEYDVIINEQGKIREIHLSGSNSDKEIMEYEEEIKKCFRILKRKFRKLQYDIVKWNGRPIRETIVLHLFYTKKNGLENFSY